jgi:hypothetical protein
VTAGSIRRTIHLLIVEAAVELILGEPEKAVSAGVVLIDVRLALQAGNTEAEPSIARGVTMASEMSMSRSAGRRTPIELAAVVVGATFLLVGILGFVPGVTQNLDAIEFAGHESGAELLGLFQVSILHNIVHLLFGVAGVVAARTIGGSRAYLIGGGLIYAVLAVYGMVIDKISDANFVPLNEADDWLHVGLAAGMILLGLALSRDNARS